MKSGQNGKTLAIALNSSWNIVNFRSGLIRGLQREGYSVVAIAPPDAHVLRLVELNVDFVPVTMDLRGTSPARDLRLLRDYYSILRQVDPDAFLGFTIKPNIYGSLAAHFLGIPVINNIAGLGETFARRTWLNRIVQGLYRASIRNSAAIFFQNPQDLDLFKEARLVRPEQARLLPGSGIDLERFTPSLPGAGVSEDFTFLMVARLLWAKGVEDYVEAARRVRAQKPQARFQLLGLAQDGRGAVDGETIRRWSEEGAIEFLGSADDVRPALTAAHCVVLPTFYPEGTPRSLLEAAATGRPLIASDVPGCREVVEHGRNGFLFPARDIDALTKCMFDLMALTPCQLADAGRHSRQVAETRFDERIVIESYVNALEALAG